MNFTTSTINKTTSLPSLGKSLKENLYHKSEIIQIIHNGLKHLFNFNSVNIYLFDIDGDEIELTYPLSNIWPLPNKEKVWLKSKKRNSTTDTLSIKVEHITNRKEALFTTKAQLERDKKKYNHHCNDGLFIKLLSEEKKIPGTVVKIPFLNKKNTEDEKEG